MSNFNEYFKNKGLKIIVDKFFDGADSYDPDNKILAIGDIYGEGKCIEFAKGQYVVIDDFNRLVSAFSLISE